MWLNGTGESFVACSYEAARKNVVGNMANNELARGAHPMSRSVGRVRFVCALAAGLGALVAAAPACLSAETIARALSSAYLGNPTLNADRARQRATDEQVPQALSGWRPTVTTQSQGGHSWVKAQSSVSGTDRWSNAETSPVGATITLTQPVFSGFGTVASTKQAEANVAAGNQQLLSTEQTVLLDAATTFMDVIRDRQIVVLREKSVSFYVEELKAAQARFSVGEITKTDVAQARAALSFARAQLQVSRANRAASTANYEKTIGHAPGALKYPPLSRRLPKSLREALRIAGRINPQILAATYNHQAAEHNVDVVQSGLLPSVNVQAQFLIQRDYGSFTRNYKQGEVLGILNIPIYQAGQVYSQVRQAKHVANERRIQIIEAGRTVRASVVQAWNNFVASGQTISSLKSQVSANRLALEGVKQEAQVGTRTTLDVLNAEQTLATSQIDLVRAQHDQVVNAYQVIVSTGQMTAKALGLKVPLYDAGANQRDVRDKFIGTDVQTVQ